MDGNQWMLWFCKREHIVFDIGKKDKERASKYYLCTHTIIATEHRKYATLKKKRRKKKKNYKLFEINRYKAFCCCYCCISYIKPILCNIKLKHMRADFFLLRFEISGFCVCWLLLCVFELSTHVCFGWMCKTSNENIKFENYYEHFDVW